MWPRAAPRPLLTVKLSAVPIHVWPRAGRTCLLAANACIVVHHGRLGLGHAAAIEPASSGLVTRCQDLCMSGPLGLRLLRRERFLIERSPVTEHILRVLDVTFIACILPVSGFPHGLRGGSDTRGSWINAVPAIRGHARRGRRHYGVRRDPTLLTLRQDP